MDTFAVFQFKRDFTIKTIQQEIQFEIWNRELFYLNAKLQEEFDSVYQNTFYVRLYEILTVGIEYARAVYNYIENSNNEEKKDFYLKYIDGFSSIKSSFDKSEYLYIEYRRHLTSHIFQDQYEHIQNDFRIKKTRKNDDLYDVNKRIMGLIDKYGNDRCIDDHINRKIQPILNALYLKLKK
jgi:hypothetical protein